MHEVIVAGDANVDIIVPYPKFLNPERTLVDYPNPVLQGGGTAANTAVALARLGNPTSFIGTLGDDQYGKYIRKDFERERVDISGLMIEPELNTIGVFAFIDEDGERYLWGWPREQQAFKELNREKISFTRIREADWVHSSGMALVHDTSARSTIIEIFKEAYLAGVPTSFDLNLRVDDGSLEPEYEKAVREIIRYTTYLLGSGTDEFFYLGESRDWYENARQFVTGERTVIVRNGSSGSIGLSKDGEVSVPAFSVEVEDTVGAGDVYNAGFITAVQKGKTLRDCLLAGNAVSGYTVERKGARSCPTSEELECFLREHKKEQEQV